MSNQTFKVFRAYKNSGKRVVLHTGKTEQEAQRLTLSYKSTKLSSVHYTAEGYSGFQPSDGTYEEGQLMTKAIKMNDPNWRQ